MIIVNHSCKIKYNTIYYNIIKWSKIKSILLRISSCYNDSYIHFCFFFIIFIIISNSSNSSSSNNLDKNKKSFLYMI